MGWTESEKNRTYFTIMCCLEVSNEDQLSNSRIRVMRRATTTRNPTDITGILEFEQMTKLYEEKERDTMK